jgi:hypothetical protein
MKKTLMLLAGLALATTAANAQDVTPANPKTEVKVRDNGTEKVVVKTGKTNVGAALDNTKDAAGNVVHKTGHVLKRGAQKTGHAVKRGAHKVAVKTKEGTAKMEAKTE